MRGGIPLAEDPQRASLVAVYTASKMAIEGFTASLAYEVVDAWRAFSPPPLLRLQHAIRELTPQCKTQPMQDVGRGR